MDAKVPKTQRVPNTMNAICIPRTKESDEDGGLDTLEAKVDIIIIAMVMLETCPSSLMVDKSAELVP